MFCSENAPNLKRTFLNYSMKSSVIAKVCLFNIFSGNPFTYCKALSNNIGVIDFDNILPKERKLETGFSSQHFYTYKKFI